MSLPERKLGAPELDDLIQAAPVRRGPRLPQHPPSQLMRVAVPRPRAPGDAVSNRGGGPVGEVGGERSGLRPRADRSGEPEFEPELMDLRLHAPTPDVTETGIRCEPLGGVRTAWPPAALSHRSPACLSQCALRSLAVRTARGYGWRSAAVDFVQRFLMLRRLPWGERLTEPQ